MSKGQSGRDNPNIVVIMADQMACDVVGAFGHPAVDTPNLDRLVQRGTAFANCYCNAPLCVPSRASFVTSRIASELDVFDNGSELRASVPTFAHQLRARGYYSVLSGKMHFIGPDQLHGFDHRVTPDFHTGSLNLTPDWRKGTYPNHGTGIKRLLDPGESRWNRLLVHDEKTSFRACEAIRELGRRSDQRPFFLWASFIHPHDPFEISTEYWQRYRDRDVPRPRSSSSQLEEMHPYDQWIQIHHEVDTTDLDEEQIANNRRAYYAMVSYIDDKVGEIINELDRMDLLDNTLIVFTSDHGEMLGEHGMWFKRTYFDPAMKVPLIFSLPGVVPEGKRIEDVVSLLDLGPTIAHFATGTNSDPWFTMAQGDSFLDLLLETDANWKNQAIFEYCGEGPIRPMAAVRKDNYKLVRVLDHPSLLFDLNEDPNEEENLAGRSAFDQIETELSTIISERFDLRELHNRVLRSQHERLAIIEALKHGTSPEWCYIPRGPELQPEMW